MKHNVNLITENKPQKSVQMLHITVHARGTAVEFI